MEAVQVVLYVKEIFNGIGTYPRGSSDPRWILTAPGVRTYPINYIVSYQIGVMDWGYGGNLGNPASNALQV